MHPIVGHHHYREGSPDYNRAEAVERAIFDRIMASPVPDASRQNSICWEARHHACTAQLGRLLADRRGLDAAICAPAMALHDIYAIETGSYKDHARLGVPIAREVLAEVGGYAPGECELILRMVSEHSRKDVYSDDPYVELCKDADLLDCFLYDRAAEEYLATKNPGIVRDYFARWGRVRSELSMPRDARFEVLGRFGQGWLQPLYVGNAVEAQHVLQRVLAAFSGAPQAFKPLLLLWVHAGGAAVLGCPEDLSQALSELPEGGAALAPATRALVSGLVDTPLAADGLAPALAAKETVGLPALPASGADATWLLATWPGFDSYDLTQGEACFDWLGLLTDGSRLAPLEWSRERR